MLVAMALFADELLGTTLAPGALRDAAAASLLSAAAALFSLSAACVFLGSS